MQQLYNALGAFAFAVREQTAKHAPSSGAALGHRSLGMATIGITLWMHTCFLLVEFLKFPARRQMHSCTCR
jgi:hypothetical protein